MNTVYDKSAPIFLEFYLFQRMVGLFPAKPGSKPPFTLSHVARSRSWDSLDGADRGPHRFDPVRMLSLESSKEELFVSKHSGHMWSRCLIEVLHRGVRLIRCYLQYIHASQNPRSAFRLRRLAESGCPRRVLVATALSLWCCAHFRTWWPLFLAGARETSCFGPKSTFSDRRKGSERLYFDMQILWQVRHFGQGGDRRGALIS